MIETWLALGAIVIGLLWCCEVLYRAHLRGMARVRRAKLRQAGRYRAVHGLEPSWSPRYGQAERAPEIPVARSVAGPIRPGLSPWDRRQQRYLDGD